MIRFAAIAVAVVMGLSAGAANAAKLQLKRPVGQAPSDAVYNWTGFYVGVHGGPAWANNRFSDAIGGEETAKFATSGHFGGGQIGYNWQKGPWVVGGELEGSWSHLQRGVTACAPFLRSIDFARILCDRLLQRAQDAQQAGGFGGLQGCPPGQTPLQQFPQGPVTCICPAGFLPANGQCIPCQLQCTQGQQGARIYKMSLLSARFGYAWDRYLLYGKAGGAVAEALYVVNVPGVVSVQRSDTRFGWMLGAGIEWAVLGNWSVKAEYNYIDFGSVRLTETGEGGTVVLDLRQTVHLAKFGLNYRFGPWAVAAKY